MAIRILVVDDHQVVRVGLRGAISRQEEFEVVGEAANGLEAIDLASQLLPDVVVMDVSMPTMNGIEATRQIKKDVSDTKVIALSMYDRKQFILDMLKAGADAYILKTNAIDDIVPAINSALKGEVFLTPRIATIVAKECINRENDRCSEPQAELSSRERQVLQLLSEGKSSKQIGVVLEVSEATVVKHRHNLMEKLELHSVAQLTKYAIQQGITSIEI